MALGQTEAIRLSSGGPALQQFGCIHSIIRLTALLPLITGAMYEYIPFEIPPRALWPSRSKLKGYAQSAFLGVAIAVFMVQPWDWASRVMKGEETTKEMKEQVAPNK